jgi:hypothetical protein
VDLSGGGPSLAGSPTSRAVSRSPARIVLGFAARRATQTVLMSLPNWVASPRHRGRLLLTFQVGMGMGIVLASIIGATQIVSCRVSVGSACVPARVVPDDAASARAPPRG